MEDRRNNAEVVEEGMSLVGKLDIAELQEEPAEFSGIRCKRDGCRYAGRRSGEEGRRGTRLCADRRSEQLSVWVRPCHRRSEIFSVHGQILLFPWAGHLSLFFHRLVRCV